ncbi:MAG: hypothetical protein MZV70_74230 [Desulfobacterales bacterium]|nr:hypothetical protein [Desulfobacterales bacterium]
MTELPPKKQKSGGEAYKSIQFFGENGLKNSSVDILMLGRLSQFAEAILGDMSTAVSMFQPWGSPAYDGIGIVEFLIT